MSKKKKEREAIKCINCVRARLIDSNVGVFLVEKKKKKIERGGGERETRSQHPIDLSGVKVAHCVVTIG